MSGPLLPPLGPGIPLAAAVAAVAAGLWLMLPRGRDRRLSQVAGAALGIAGIPGFWLAARGGWNGGGPGGWTLLAFAATLLAGGGWLLLPRSRGLVWRIVAFLVGLPAVVALGFLAWRARDLGAEQGVFVIVSLVAVVSGAATVLTRSPVYSAIWFAMALAGVSGVMLVLGGQFLGVATIVVYAGAILVMFLFVLMLAQPSGLAPYDRVSNEPFLSALAGAVLLGLLTLSIGGLSAAPVDGGATTASTADPLAADHVARLGGELFGRHLVSVEASGLLLLVALVGAVAVVSRNESSGGEGSR